jgi:hypothetical protein
MKFSTKIVLIFSIICLVTFDAIAQFEPNTSTKKIDKEITTGTNTGQFKNNTSNSKVSPQNLDLNFNKEININAINKNLNNYTSVNDPNFLLENLPEDNDIIGRKYWQNQDVTHKKLGSNFSLGTINSITKTVRVECRDYSYVDGDIIKIYINQQPLENNVVLKGGNYVVYLDLNEGYNRIDFQALNQGLSGPNTAELRLYDANDNLISSKEWNLLTGQIATLGVIYK